MAFFAKCFCYNRRSWKEGSWIAERWGPFERSVTQQREKVRLDRQTQTANCKVLTIPSCCLHHTSFTSGRNKNPQKQKTPAWESQYEVMECIPNWFGWLKTETVSSSTPHPIPSPSIQSNPVPRWGGVISDQRPVGSKDVDLCVRRKWVQIPSPAFPQIFSF